MNEKKTPAIRFQEFTDDWKQRKLGDKMYIKSRIGWQRLTKDEYLSSGEYYLITGTDIDEYTHTIDLKHSYYVSKDRYDKDSNIQVHNGDIIVTKDGTIGKVAMVCNLDKPATLNSHLFVLRDMSGKIYNRFLLQFLTSDVFTRFVDATKTGSTLTGMPQKIFVKFQYMIPSFSEQKKVADMLDGIANIIAIHQRKLTKLQLLKKSMLTKMFPKDGARVPEIRFQGFHDNWEQRRLGECCREFKSGSFISANDIESSGEYPVWGGNGLRGFTTTYNHDGEFALIGRQGALCGNMSYSTGKAYFTEHAIAVQTNETADTKFMYYLLDTMNLGQYSDQSAQPGLAVGKLVKLMNLFPSVAEQKCLSNYFTNLDMFIALHQHKLSKLQKIKQAMLSKLFV